MLDRLLTLVTKELQALLRNRQGRMLLIAPVLMETLMFPFAATLEVTNSTLAVLNQDGAAESIELVQRLACTAAFPNVLIVGSDRELTRAIDEQKALVAIRFPADFSRLVTRGQPASIQVIVDGRRSNSAQIAYAYVERIVDDYVAEKTGIAMTNVEVMTMYNPNVEFRWHVLPSLVATITAIGCLIVSGLSVAREREEGTFDQLLVSPLTPAVILAGKALPGIMVALAQGTIVAAAAIWLYGVPFSGSVLVLYIGILSYGLALVGVGLFISSISSTQQQAFLGVFAFVSPAIMLSGLVAPVENMPWALRMVSHANPLTHFIVNLKGVFLKGYGLAEAWPNLWPQLLIAVITLVMAYWMFRRHIA